MNATAKAENATRKTQNTMTSALHSACVLTLYIKIKAVTDKKININIRKAYDLMY